MRRLFSPAMIVMLTAAVILTGLGFFVISPLAKAIQAQRTHIDAARANIASLNEQQRNIESVSKNFARLVEQDDAVGMLFLTESGAVTFFNHLDDLADASSILNFEKQLDTPGAKASQQLLGIRLDFTASYANAQSFITGLTALRPAVAVQSVTYSQRGASEALNVHIDAVTPWELQQ